MREIKIVHCGDIHLGFQYQFLKEKARIMRQELFQSFTVMLHWCEREQVDFLLIAGDLLDEPNIENGILEELRIAFSNLTITKVVISPGNHDFYWRNSPYALENFWSDNVFIFSEESHILFEEEKVCVFGAGFRGSYIEKSQWMNNLVSNLEDVGEDWTKLGVYHGDLVSFGQNSLYNPITKEEIGNCKLDYLALGHIHKRSQVEQSGDTNYAYSGSLTGLGYDELGEKGFYYGVFAGKEKQISFVPGGGRKFLSYHIEIEACTEEGLGGLCNYILHFLESREGEGFSRNLYHLILRGDRGNRIDFHVDRLEHLLSEELFHCKLKDETRSDREIKMISQENTFQGIFVKNALEEMKNSNEDTKRYERIIKLGLKAFSGEVNYHGY